MSFKATLTYKGNKFNLSEIANNAHAMKSINLRGFSLCIGVNHVQAYESLHDAFLIHNYNFGRICVE